MKTSFWRAFLCALGFFLVLAPFNSLFAQQTGEIRGTIEVNPVACPKCQGEMRIIAFLTDYAVVDRIINHLKLTFVADRPPPPHIADQEVPMAAEPSAESIS